MINVLKALFKKKLPAEDHECEIDVNSWFDALLTLSALLREKGEFVRAIKILDELKSRCVSREQQKLIYFQFVVTYKKAGLIDRAEKQALKAIGEFPDDARFYREVSYIKQMYGDWEGAVKFMDMACRFGGNYLRELMYLKLNLVNIYSDKGNIRDALRLLKATEITHPAPFLYYTIAKLHFALGDKNTGLSDVVTGMRISGRQSYIFIELISEHLEVNAELIENLIREVGEDRFLLMTMVNVLIKDGRMEEALEWLERSLMKFPDDAMFIDTYIDVLWKLGYREKAFREALKCIRKQVPQRRSFKCNGCGYISSTFSWLCPRCKSWETMELNIAV